MNLKVLWESIKKGDKEAFLQLYETFYQDLYAYGFKMSGRKELVKDCIQQVFLEIWDGRNALNDVSFLKPYLLKYFKRKLFREITLRNREGNLLHTFPGMEPSYEEVLIRNISSEELQFKLHEALEKLTNKQKQVIRMKFFEGLSYEEIAEITSSKHRTIYNQVYEALKILKDHITAIALTVLTF